jgi:hypothetical protein
MQGGVKVERIASDGGILIYDRRVILCDDHIVNCHTYYYYYYY